MNGLAPTPQLSTTLCSTALPRATGLTDALLAPAGPALPVRVLAAVTERLRTALGPTGRGADGRPPPRATA